VQKRCFTWVGSSFTQKISDWAVKTLQRKTLQLINGGASAKKKKMFYKIVNAIKLFSSLLMVWIKKARVFYGTPYEAGRISEGK
jgi:hypothetical protein